MTASGARRTHAGIKGFTLVELIVVIAIIGVLAAILVPSMMGHIKDSRYSTANANAKTVYTAAQTFVTQMEVKGTPISWWGVVTGTPADGTLITNHRVGLDNTMGKYIGTGDAAGEYAVYFDRGVPTFTWWRKTSADATVGTYPTQSSAEDPIAWRATEPEGQTLGVVIFLNNP